MLLSLIFVASCLFTTFTVAFPAPKMDTIGDLALRDAKADLLEGRHVEDLEKRQDANTMRGLADTAADDAWAAGGSDGTMEGAFTSDLCSSLYSYYPTKNVLIYHDQDSYRDLSDDAVHLHYEFPLIIAGTYGYEIYVFDTGYFKLAGDGGYLNWAICGDFSSPDDNGLITFYQRS